jgi:hypothetical protein
MSTAGHPGGGVLVTGDDLRIAGSITQSPASPTSGQPADNTAIDAAASSPTPSRFLGD